ncbi:hypothetical protein Hanom_Chr04g00320021 [Helianthus anomalus]
MDGELRRYYNLGGGTLNKRASPDWLRGAASPDWLVRTAGHFFWGRNNYQKKGDIHLRRRRSVGRKKRDTQHQRIKKEGWFMP